MPAFRGKITLSIVASRADEGAQLTRRNCIRTRLGSSCAISLVSRVEYSRPVVAINVVIAGDASCAPISL